MNTQSPESLNSEAQQLSVSLHHVESEKAQGSKSNSSVKSSGSAEEASIVASPSAGVKEEGKFKAAAGTPDSKASTPKKKRKSPEKPWKKPPDMPRRPLSAYNLFFQDEKNRLKEERMKSGQAPASLQSSAEGGDKKSKGKRKHVAVSGIGFANLAKTVAAKWKSLDAETRKPYEERAAIDKARYDKAVKIWREKEKEKKAREKSATVQANYAVSFARNPGEGLEIPPAPSDQSLASLSALDHPADWFPTHNDSNLHDQAVPPQIQTNTRPIGSLSGRMSPHGPTGYMGHGRFLNPNSPSAMSPLGTTTTPLAASSGAGIHTFHNQTVGNIGNMGGRIQMPMFPESQNSYSYNNASSLGGGVPSQSHLQPRRPVQLMGGGNHPSNPDWGYPTQFMQQSSMPQSTQAFPEDYVPSVQDSLAHPVHFQQPQPLPFPPSFAPPNAHYDSYQMGPPDPSPVHQQHYQSHNSYASGSQTQQPQPPPPMGLMAPPQFNPANQPNNSQPGEFFDDPMMEYLTHLRDNRDASGHSQQQSPENP